MSVTGMTTTRAHYRTIHGVPGLAVRLGRLLELWGTRAARPLERDELLHRREADRIAQRAVAERDAMVARHAFIGIR